MQQYTENGVNLTEDAHEKTQNDIYLHIHTQTGVLLLSCCRADLGGAPVIWWIN